jgi:glycosyltransferase involved in cell wall biosynthesis
LIQARAAVSAVPPVSGQPCIMKFSVILPYRDEAPYLRTCLESLARQTHRDFEVIAVDDGSSDGSPEIVEAFQGRFPAMEHLETSGKGLVPALNAALALARGEAVARADGDDLYHPRRLEAQARLLENGVDVAGCLVRFFPREDLMEGFSIYERWINRLRTPTAIASEIFVETPIAHPSLAIRRSLLERLGGYRDEAWPEDFDLMLRAHLAGAVFGKVPEVLHFWREHPDRLCRRDARYSLEAFIRCRCHHLARGPLGNRKRLVIWGAGPIGKKTGACLLEEGIDFGAFIDIDPRKIGGIVHGRKVCAPSFLARNPAFVLCCVGKRGARYLVKADLEAMGFRERLDFILAA